MSKAMRWIIKGAAIITFGMLFLIIGYIIVKGFPNLSLSLFETQYTTDNVSMYPAIITTLIVVGLSLIIATPLGVGTGIYLIEYAKRGSKVVEIIRITTETLSGIPSIIYGLFGMLFYVISLKLGFSIYAGVFTLSIMILPIIIRSTEEALLAINDELRFGSLALGAGKLRTTVHVVLPGAMPGILSGVILAIGRCVGETAALIYTLGTATAIPAGLGSSGRTLALHMYVLSTEGLHVKESFATGLILLLLTLAINTISTFLGNRMIGGK